MHSQITILRQYNTIYKEFLHAIHTSWHVQCHTSVGLFDFLSSAGSTTLQRCTSALWSRSGAWLEGAILDLGGGRGESIRLSNWIVMKKEGRGGRRDEKGRKDGEEGGGRRMGEGGRERTERERRKGEEKVFQSVNTNIMLTQTHSLSSC